MGLSCFSLFFLFKFLIPSSKKEYLQEIETQTWVLNHIEYSRLVNERFKEEGKVQRAKFYPRINSLTNFLTNTSLVIYFANKFSWTNACFKGHFIVQVLMRLQPCGHSRWVLLLKMPDGKFLSWLLFNNLSKLKLVYFQLHGIRQQSSRNKSARKKVVTSLLQKK